MGEVQPGVVARTVQQLGAGSKMTLDATQSAAGWLTATAQGLLASSLASDLNSLLQSVVKGSATIYDKAMDARYLDPVLRADLGGGYHRLFDGGHTIPGAFAAARSASPDDNIVQEALGAIQGLLRDGTTARGLPFATWDKATFDAVAESLKSNFGIPKSWFYDLNTYDVAEVLGGAVGTVGVIFGWNRADTEEFSKLVGSMGISAAVSANPLLLVVTVVALARAFHKARETGEFAELVDGQMKGGITAGAALGAVALVGSAGGPAGLALLVGITAGVLASAATKNVSVATISEYAADGARSVASVVSDGAEAAGDVVAYGAVKAAEGAKAAGEYVSDGARAAGGAVAKGAARAADAAKAAGEYVSDGARSVGAVVADGARVAGDVAVSGARAAGGAVSDGARVAGDVAAKGAAKAADGVRGAGRRGLDELRSRTRREEDLSFG